MKLRPPSPLTMQAIEAEVTAARLKFPGNKTQLAALTEEVGELAQALLDLERGETDADHVQKEAIQVAAMAIRVLEEGDSSFPAYPPTEV